ncbi:MAG: hydrogenase maturation nickel metallochaperone HypA [bacterium]|nr:hydrogenase maturation nickel metallochaperone HypA [bacterium]
MHEYSLVSALLDRVAAEAKAHAGAVVHHVKVRIGELSGVEGELFGSAFEMIREGTICARADLEVIPVKARWLCPRCERAIPSGEILRCPDCSLPARLAGGDEIVLERIEMEVA